MRRLFSNTIEAFLRLGLILFLFAFPQRVVQAQSALGTFSAAGAVNAIATNPATDMVYVANASGITILNARTGAISNVTVSGGTAGIAVNAATNKIYATNPASASLTVIDGATNAVATIPVGNNPNPVAVNAVTNKIYVGNENDGTVSVIDGATSATTTVAVAGAPNSIAVNPVTNVIYVGGTYTTQEYTVAVINGANNAVSQVTVGAFVRSVAVNPVTNKVYATILSGSSLYVIDGPTQTVTQLSVVGQPQDVAVNVITDTIYVAIGSSQLLTAVDGGTNAVTRIDTSAKGYGVAVDPLTNKIYVTNDLTGSSASVSIVDGVTNAVTPFATGTQPAALAINPITHRVYAGDASGTVTVLEGSTLPVSTVTVGSTPSAVVVNPATDRAYVANSGGSTVSVIDLNGFGVTSVRVGNGPAALALDPVSNLIYVANKMDGSVTKINGANNATSTILLGQGTGPEAIAVNPFTHLVYVANSTADTVSVIDGSSVTTLTGFDVPVAVAINAETDTIYVANNTTTLSGGSVTVIDGVTNGQVTISGFGKPVALAVDPVSSLVYVADQDGGAGIIDPSLPVSDLPIDLDVPDQYAVTVDPQLNRVYFTTVMGFTVFDGTTYNGTLTDGSGLTVTSEGAGESQAVLVDAVHNRVFLAETRRVGGAGFSLTAIDEGLNLNAFYEGGDYPSALALNPASEQLVLANSQKPSGGNKVAGNAVTIVKTDDSVSVPITTSLAAVTDSATIGNANIFETSSSTPSFTATAATAFVASSTYSANTSAGNPPITGLYYQVDGGGPWSYLAAPANTGSATFAITSPAVSAGLHTMYVFAAYGDEDGSNASPYGQSPEIANMAGLSFFVQQVATTTSVSGSPNPAATGSTVTLTATVFPSTATGTVSFTATSGGTTVSLGSPVTLSGGTASLSYSFATAGTYVVTARYSGDASNAAGEGTVSEVIGTPDSTALSITANPTSLLLSQSVALSATVTDSTSPSSTPTGSVTFYDTYGTTTVNAGTVTLTGTTNPVSSIGSGNYTPSVAGSHTITAIYTPSSAALYTSSNSNSVPVTVSQTLGSFQVTGPTIVHNGVARSYTVTALDTYGNVYTGYTGTANITSSDPNAELPSEVGFNPGYGGTSTFEVNFGTAGTQSLTATAATATGSLTGIVVDDAIEIINANQSMVLLAEDGTVVRSGTSAAITNAAVGLAVDASGDSWSLIPATNTLLRFNRTGDADGSFTGGGLSSPAGLAIDGAGRVWIANGNDSVSVFSNAGTAVSPSGGYPTGATGGSTAISIDTSGDVWLATQSGVVEMIGAAAPSAPLANAVTNVSVGAKP
jgi:YVTN family beta-propeller protein